MNKKLIEYLIIATAIIILLYGCYALIGYKYLEEETAVTDSITLYRPLSSGYTVVGDTVEFRNSLYDFYDMDVSKLNSSDGRVTNLLNHFAHVSQGTLDYKNSSCYVLTMEFKDDKGFNYHSILIPVDSFDENSMSFKNSTTVYLFDANNRDFVVDTAFNSKVVM